MQARAGIVAGLAALGLLAGCWRSDAPVAMAAGPRITLPLAGVGLPDFPPADTAMEPRSNAVLAQDFLDLEFRMESGRPLPRLTRFDQPVTVGIAGPAPGSASADLDALLARLRAEAGLQISRDDAAPQITVQFVPQAQIAALHPDVACFVVPGATDWHRYRQGQTRQDWAALTRRDRAAVFIPQEASPQEQRDCLHEEIAQGLGPLNDLYRLPDSVFNDDNFHTVLTGFDMLMLRLHYAPELQQGMDPAAVAAALPALLARLNPSGGPVGELAPAPPDPQAWLRLMAQALSDRGTPEARRRAADRALAVAQAQGWQDARLAFSQFAVGRLAIGQDALAASRALIAAGTLYRAQPGGAVAAAHVDMQLAALALAQGDARRATAFTRRAIPVARRAQNAALLSMLMLMQAEAQQALGRPAAAQALRLDSRTWARYGFGSETVLAGQLETIAALLPPGLAADPAQAAAAPGIPAQEEP